MAYVLYDYVNLLKNILNLRLTVETGELIFFMMMELSKLVNGAFEKAL